MIFPSPTTIIVFTYHYHHTYCYVCDVFQTHFKKYDSSIILLLLFNKFNSIGDIYISVIVVVGSSTNRTTSRVTISPCLASFVGLFESHNKDQYFCILLLALYYYYY